MPKSKSSISKAQSLEAVGDFWDNHDFTDFDDDKADIEYELSSSLSIEPDLLSDLEQQAKLRGVSTETLVNLWLNEKLSENQLVHSR
jgi:hypothetical protein